MFYFSMLADTLPMPLGKLSQLSTARLLQRRFCTLPQPGTTQGAPSMADSKRIPTVQNSTKLMGGSINGGTPIAGWFVMEHPIKIDGNPKMDGLFHGKSH